MFEYTNILLKIADPESHEIKYIPVTPEVARMNLKQISKMVKLKEAYIDIVYNDNKKSPVKVVNFAAKYPHSINEEPYAQKIVWQEVLVDLISAIAQGFYYEDATISKGIPEEAKKATENAEFTLYTIFGEDTCKRICQEIMLEPAVVEHNFDKIFKLDAYGIIDKLGIILDESGNLSVGRSRK